MAVRLHRLQRQAFAERARTDPGRVERLDQRQRRLGLGQGNAQVSGHFAQGDGQIAGLIQLIDQVAGDEGEPRIAGLGTQLVMEMRGEVLVALPALIDVEPGFARWADALVGAPFAAAAFAITGIAVTIERGMVDIEGAIVSGAAFGDQLVNRRGFQRRPAQVGNLLDRRGVRRRFADIKQRIALQRLADEGFDLEV